MINEVGRVSEGYRNVQQTEWTFRARSYTAIDGLVPTEDVKSFTIDTEATYPQILSRFQDFLEGFGYSVPEADKYYDY